MLDMSVIVFIALLGCTQLAAGSRGREKERAASHRRNDIERMERYARIRSEFEQ